MKGESGIDGLTPQRRVYLVEVGAALLKLVGKQVSERDHLRNGVLRERCGYVGAAVTAAQQSMAHSRVGLVTEGRPRLQ